MPAVGIQQQHLQRIAQIMMVHLVGADAMELDARIGRDQKIKHVAQRPGAGVRSGQRGSRYLNAAAKRFTNESAGSRLECQQFDNFAAERDMARVPYRLAQDEP